MRLRVKKKRRLTYDKVKIKSLSDEIMAKIEYTVHFIYRYFKIFKQSKSKKKKN